MECKEEKLLLLGNEKVSKALLKLGIPTMIGLMTSSLYNLVDSYFVGNLGTSQMAAVSVVFPLSIIILGIGLLFGTGASSYLSRLLGEKKYKEADECASTAVTSSVILAVIIVILMLVFLNPLLRVLGATDTIMPYAREYGIIFIIGLMFNVFNITVNNIITSEGASFYSMIAMLIGGIINIVLDPICILTFQMGVSGAAIATLVSRCISTSLYLYYIKSGKSNFTIKISNFRLNKKIFIEIFKIGIPMLVYQFLCSFALSLTNNQASDYGASAVAALGIVNRIISLGMMIIMGFLKGYQPLVGYNYTAGKKDRIKEATKLVLIGTSIFCIILCTAMICGRYSLISLFSKNDSDVMSIGIIALILNAITFLSMGYQLVYSTMFMGLGKAKEGGLISLGRQGIFFIPIIIAGSHLFGLNGIIASQPLADVCSLALVIFLSYKNKL